MNKAEVAAYFSSSGKIEAYAWYVPPKDNAESVEAEGKGI